MTAYQRGRPTVARKRFNREERAAFTVGAAIEWRNGGHWHEGRITGPIATDVANWHCVPLVHTGRTTATVSHGQRITGTPGAVRLPSPRCERCGRPVVPGYEIPDPDMPCPSTRSTRGPQSAAQPAVPKPLPEGR